MNETISSRNETIKSTDKMMKRSPDKTPRSSDEKLTAPNPLYSTVTISKSAHVGVDNTVYQSGIRNDAFINHEYETISLTIDNVVVEHS